MLFDLDGTLVETNIDFARMRREMTALALSAGVCRDELEGLDILAIVNSATAKLRAHGKPREALMLYGRAMRALERIEIPHARSATEIPFAKQLLAELESRGIATGIVTRNSRRASLIAMETAGIRAGVLVCREDSERHKPHPDPIHIALERLGARPKASVMVGDHLMDVQSGKAAGLMTIGLLRDHRPENFFDGVSPDRVARSLKEVLSAIIDRDS